ncbi:ABC transporter [Gracilaria domingensis]|nr:ABC transporter [Gracilaria domingensis]
MYHHWMDASNKADSKKSFNCQMAFLPSRPLITSPNYSALSTSRNRTPRHASTNQSAARRNARTTPVMGLNAKNLAKNKKKGGKKKGRSANTATAQSTTPPRAKANTIDTNRREYIYQMVGVSKTLNNGKQILKNITLAYFPGVKIGVVGSNGSGKSTLLKIIAGLDSEYDGIAAPQNGIKIGYLAQEPVLEEDTVEANIAQAVSEPRGWLERYAELGKMIGEEGLTDAAREKITTEWESLQNKIEASNAWELDRNIDRAREAMRCPPGNARIENLSGGEKRRVALCALLLTRPDLLILDEPTNHLDALSVLWLERFLETYKGTVICVTHDRFFLEALTDWILEIDNGQAFPYEGNYSTYLEKKAKRMAEEEKVASSRQKLIRQELEWIRTSPKGQQAKSKARISRYESLLEEDSKVNRQSVLDRIYIPAGPKLGDIVVEAEGVRKGFGENVLFENMTFSLPRGGIVGVIGPNGAGKVKLDTHRPSDCDNIEEELNPLTMLPTYALFLPTMLT